MIESAIDELLSLPHTIGKVRQYFTNDCVPRLGSGFGLCIATRRQK
jgi:hypothetical protein